jgi:hypothetical protein
MNNGTIYLGHHRDNNIKSKAFFTESFPNIVKEKQLVYDYGNKRLGQFTLYPDLYSQQIKQQIAFDEKVQGIKNQYENMGYHPQLDASKLQMKYAGIISQPIKQTNYTQTNYTQSTRNRIPVVSYGTQTTSSEDNVQSLKKDLQIEINKAVKKVTPFSQQSFKPSASNSPDSIDSSNTVVQKFVENYKKLNDESPLTNKGKSKSTNNLDSRKEAKERIDKVLKKGKK